MNSSNKEKFVSVRAKTNYTVLICETKNIYVSDKITYQFLPLFGRSNTSGNQHHNKKLEPCVYLGSDYLISMDLSKSIFYHKLFAPNFSAAKQYTDKKFAVEIFANSNFIEIYPTDRDIWAINSLRQLLVARDFKKH